MNTARAIGYGRRNEQAASTTWHVAAPWALQVASACCCAASRLGRSPLKGPIGVPLRSVPLATPKHALTNLTIGKHVGWPLAM